MVSNTVDEDGQQPAIDGVNHHLPRRHRDHGQNLRLRRAVRDLGTVGGDPRYPLLFDPQTAGGLLATVPEDRAEACVAQLRGLGYVRTSVIGRVLPQTNRLEPLTLLT
jgi:selenide, water dikinase